MKKYCKCCGKQYEVSLERKTVCSAKCNKRFVDNINGQKMFAQYCTECGKQLYDFQERRFCSKECRDKAIARDKNQSILDGDIKVDHLTETLAYCKKLGISYREYQIRQTLALLGNKTNDKSG